MVHDSPASCVSPSPAANLISVPEALQGPGEASQQFVGGKEGLTDSLQTWRLGTPAPVLDVLLVSC